MKKIGAAVIGLGAMGTSDLEILHSLDFVTRLAGVDPSPEKREAARGKFGIRVTDKLAEIWNDDGIELVYITTPNRFHVPVAIEALHAGKKVMVEKPMGVNEAQLAELLRVVRETRGFLQVGFECRNYSRLYVRIKEIIDSGEIGQVRHIHFTYCLQPFERGSWKCDPNLAGGIYTEKLCHYVDLPRWWIGEKVSRFFSIQAPNVIPYYGIADNALCSYEFEGGAVSQLSFIEGPAHTYTPDEARAMKPTRADLGYGGHRNDYLVVGTEGALESALFDRSLKVFYHAGKPTQKEGSRLIRVETWSPGEDARYFHNTREQNIDIARRVAAGEPPALDPEEAAETMRLCFAFQRAAAAGWAVEEYG